MVIRLFKRLWVRWRLRGLKGAGRMAVRYQIESAAMLEQLKDRASELLRLRVEVLDVAENASRDAEAIDVLSRQHATVVESLQSQLKIREDVELPLLTAINEANLQRYRTEVQIQALRQVAPDDAVREGS